MKKYIHYGTKFFDKDKFVQVENQGHWSKPSGGFWASPIDTSNGWRDWCRIEEPEWCDEEIFFTFKLSDRANVIHIKSIDDLNRLSFVGKCLIHGIVSPDFEKMCQDGVDAIELHLSNENGIDRNLNFALYGWDCDSILIMNPEIILTEME